MGENQIPITHSVNFFAHGWNKFKHSYENESTLNDNVRDDFTECNKHKIREGERELKKKLIHKQKPTLTEASVNSSVNNSKLIK